MNKIVKKVKTLWTNILKVVLCKKSTDRSVSYLDLTIEIAILGAFYVEIQC